MRAPRYDRATGQRARCWADLTVTDQAQTGGPLVRIQPPKRRHAPVLATPVQIGLLTTEETR